LQDLGEARATDEQDVDLEAYEVSGARAKLPVGFAERVSPLRALATVMEQ
jgi:hypothetical protein